MNPRFSTEPVRTPAKRGESPIPFKRARHGDIWPRPDRDPGDVAVIAARLLSASGRIQTRLRATARREGLDPNVFRLLLLFADSNRPLRIGNVAELLAVSQSTASRTAKRAQAAGLVDKFPSPIDGREVTVRLSVPGRIAVAGCLDAIRVDAARVLGVSSARSHPRGAELLALLGPPPMLTRSSAHPGWRAGVRIGMWGAA